MTKHGKSIPIGVTAAIVVAAVGLAVIFGFSSRGTSTTTNPKTPKTNPTTSTVLPSVGSADETAPVDTTKDPRTPATFVPFHKSNHVDKTWAELYKDVTNAKAQWYIDAVNDRADKTGFDWNDIQKWATDPQLNGSTPLTIQIFGDFSDSQARAIAAQLVGKDQAAVLKIFRHPVGILGNTRSVGFEKVGDFLDLRKMVRLSLGSIVYDKNGKAIDVGGNSGIFADCFNIWWLVGTPGQPGKPGQPGQPGQPGTPPPGLTPKDPSLDPWPRGNAPTGGGRNQDPGPGTYIPPAGMVQPPTTARVNPTPPPATTPPIGSKPDPVTAPPKVQPVDPVVPPTPASAPGR